MGNSSEEVSPAWGSLPVEKYLLARWDSASTLSVTHQRDQLVQAFLKEDDVSPFTSTFSDASLSADIQNLIDTVLVPWRPQKLRRIAEKYARDMAFDSIVVLRTYYGGVGDEDRMTRWVYDAAESFEDSNPGQNLFGDLEDHWWHVLDDASLFDTGSGDWQSVYNALPELATPALQRNFNQHVVDSVKEEMLAILETREPEEEDYEDAASSAAVQGCWLLVLDEEAFKDEEMLLIFRDMKGDVIRQISIKPDEVENLPHYRLRGSIRESGYWTDAVVAKKYKSRGEVMRAVLPLIKAELE
ncbi:hypothetical protein HG530_007091 [Fusarium avenaceum]|nr:hypothetical protein HG530_007091 [Fusarium avenaceum]